MMFFAAQFLAIIGAYLDRAEDRRARFDFIVGLCVFGISVWIIHVGITLALRG
jgi:hypothetical protein